jgi:hypothetical protein
VQRAVAEGFIAPQHAGLMYVEEDAVALLSKLRAHRPGPHVRKWIERAQTWSDLSG